jgi:F-type H+-transporting ATPase subunit a
MLITTLIFAKNLTIGMALKRLQYRLVLLFGLFFALLGNTANAQHDSHDKEAPHGEEKPFNITETILEHVSDSYGWHLWGHTTLPLPVILYTDKGLEVFSSSNLIDEHHNPKMYKGNNNYQVNHHSGKLEIIDDAGKPVEGAKLLDFSITKNVASLLLSVFIILVLFLSVARAYTKRGVTSAPKGLQSFMEPLILFVRDDVAKPNIGHKYAKYMPLLLTLFFFIWLNNMLGLVPFFPGGANLSGNIAFTVVLAVIVFIVVNVSGNKGYWGHIVAMPGVPKWLLPLLTPIEILGIFTKPISLAIRLFANITAGHVLVLALICLVFVFKSVYVGPASVLFAGFIFCIELLVAFLQAFIFTMLTALYIGMAVEEHHHGEAHH